MDREKFIHLRQFGWAPGDYFITCGNCNQQATGDKRAISCQECAEKAFAAAPKLGDVGGNL